MSVPSSGFCPPPLSPQPVCHPPPFEPKKGGGGQSLVDEGLGGANNSDDWRECLALCILCGTQGSNSNSNKLNAKYCRR